MPMEALSCNELLINLIIHNNDTISSTPLCNNNNNTCTLDSSSNFLFKSSNAQSPQEVFGATNPQIINEAKEMRPSCAVQGRKKRRRRPKVCKNKEEAETQRMTHIRVERNRRRQMNDHLAVLRSLMPESYVQRGDQASIVGGAIDFVKELQHLLQSLEAQKFQQLQDSGRLPSMNNHQCTTPTADGTISSEIVPNPFAQFFTYPQYCSSNTSNKFTCSKTNGAVADIEVTLIETHASIRILSRRRLRQLSRMVAGFQTIYLNILHLNVTTLDPLVLYSISAKVEEGCVMNSADEVAGGVHLMLKIIEEEAYEDHQHN